ncbi:putative DNA-binding domain-containing protein, partial [Dokdonella sp.]|uniref:HvfC/BufC family peptide modification chaperone n=1 Tax=Dokdonella sp. TaxID=2291710 RepID=UPI003C4A36FE
MIALRDLEHHFLDHVRGGAQFPRGLCQQGRVDSDIGLGIYANAYHSRLSEALESDHPVLSRYLGDALWEEFCTRFVNDCPSRVRSLRHFGAQAPAWLAATEPFAAHPLISELAEFERLLLDAFDAGDAPRSQWSDIRQLDADAWPRLRLEFHPSVRLLRTACNTVEIWQALKDERDPPATAGSCVPAHLLWRDEERITRFRPVDPDELIALQVSFQEAGDFALL